MAGRLIPRVVARLSKDAKKAGDKSDDTSLARHATELLAGLEFGLGLHITQMSNPAKVAAFLSFPRFEVWDPSMMLVIAFGILPSLFENLSKGFNKPPLFTNRYELGNKTIADTDWKLVLGAAAFAVLLVERFAVLKESLVKPEHKQKVVESYGRLIKILDNEADFIAEHGSMISELDFEQVRRTGQS
ncbi:hypothetical protein SLS60_004150 [Paraconiothyrium brasiliense]|uniref:Uncharacterized protein n=1 Tax=Paraconiothyrium brasiliense TaxID=300254 RepID=A0ABR3RQM4_9PLEO